MNWETFYLVCFLAGLMLSFISLLGGMGHFGGHVHVPHVHVPHVGHVHIPHGAGISHPASGGSAASGGPDVPWWNAFSIMIFLCWFGAAGYLLTKYGSFVAGLVVVLAAMCGLAGGAIIFMFLTKVLMPHDRELTADETDVVGVVGRVSSPIRVGGVGEIVYQQLGATRSAIARSDDETGIERNDEVYVVRYEKGVAYVRRWEDLPEANLQGVGNREQGVTTKN
jgi:membrane protein implicated in regulation of membrane protease activity